VRRLAIMGAACLVAACGREPKAPIVDPAWSADSVARWVDPFIGTHGDGNTFPGATVPWGMVSPSPHTRRPIPADVAAGSLAAAGYVDDDPQIHGFGLTHLSGVGCPDLGAPVVAVTRGAVNPQFEAYGATRRNERAWPGYYATELVEPKAEVELTATPRGAALRFFDRGDGINVLVDAARSLSWNGPGGRVHVVSPAEVEGEVQTGLFCVQGNQQKVYFVARFDRPAAQAGTWKDDVPGDGSDAEGNVGAWFRFPAAGGRSVELHVGISYVSVDGARANLEAELGGRGFDEVRAQAQQAWEDALGRVRVDGGTDQARTIFYTALYHALLHPSVASDVDGSYVKFGGGIGHDPDHERYDVFSLWDTYRTVHPLLALLYPEQQREMVRSILGMTLEAGAPPMWELAGSEVQMMVGDPADIVLADSAHKGLLPDGDLAARAWPLLQAAALDTSAKAHRPGNASYRARGYVAMDESAQVWGPVSTTLEYALADDALVRLGAALGVAVDPALQKGADSWKSLIDPETQLFRPRQADGTFMTPFDPDALEGAHAQPRSGGPGFVEGTAWQYGFFVPHAVVAHAAATGGADVYVARLQTLFDSGRFAMWNEPDLGFPYLFTHFAGQGWRTAAAVQQARQAFGAGHDGIPGNDDCGTMSAWYVLSALGVYPDVPDGDDYAIGTPLFDRATLTVTGGAFAIDAPHPTPDAIYVRHADVDGKDVGQRLPWAAIKPGAVLHLDLSNSH
jgi:predicted alpha-1,2-mannosidase